MIYAPPPVLQRTITRATQKLGRKDRRLQYRSGEGRLVKWAEEDIGILDEQEDFINGNANFDIEYGAASEEIPLTMSPKRGFFGTKYGSA